jgi:hypothetical protein
MKHVDSLRTLEGAVVLVTGARPASVVRWVKPWHGGARGSCSPTCKSIWSRMSPHGSGMAVVERPLNILMSPTFPRQAASSRTRLRAPAAWTTSSTSQGSASWERFGPEPGDYCHPILAENHMVAQSPVTAPRVLSGS